MVLVADQTLYALQRPKDAISHGWQRCYFGSQKFKDQTT